MFQNIENTHVPEVHLDRREFQPINLNSPSLESILFQNGYLTIDKQDPTNDLYTLKFPNKEVMEAFMVGVQLAMQEDIGCIRLHRKAKSSIQNININNFVKTFNTFLQSRRRSSRDMYV